MKLMIILLLQLAVNKIKTIAWLPKIGLREGIKQTYELVSKKLLRKFLCFQCKSVANAYD